MSISDKKPKQLAERLFGDDGSVIKDPTARLMIITGGLMALSVTAISPLLLDLSQVFNITTNQVGLLVTAFTAPPIILIPIAGIVADLVGRKWLLVGGLLIFGISGGAIGLVSWYPLHLPVLSPNLEHISVSC